MSKKSPTRNPFATMIRRQPMKVVPDKRQQKVERLDYEALKKATCESWDSTEYRYSDSYYRDYE